MSAVEFVMLKVSLFCPRLSYLFVCVDFGHYIKQDMCFNLFNSPKIDADISYLDNMMLPPA